MSTTTTQSRGYLEQQFEKAKNELGIEAEKNLQLSQHVEQFYPAVEQAARSLEQKLKHIALTRAEAERSKARSDSLVKSLTLKPVFNNGFALIVTWAVLLFLSPFILGKFIGIIASIALYVWLVKKGMTKEAIKKTQARYDSMMQLSNSRISLMHFGEKESGDQGHPYLSIHAPLIESEKISSTWRIDKRFGSMFGADFLVIHPVSAPLKHYAVVQVREGNTPQIVDITANVDGWDWPLHQELLHELGLQASEEIKTIQTYAEHAEEQQRLEQIVGSLLQRIATLKDVMENWDDVSIEDETLDRVIKLVDLFVSGRKPSPKGILLYGPPGTGKTLIARKLAKTANCHFEAVNIADLKGTHIGQTGPKVKELWERCREHSPTILFVDECESAFATRGGTDNDSFGNELVQTFISEWDGFNQASGQVLVVAATNRRDILDTAVMSRFTTAVEIGLPNDVARRKILQNEFKQADLGFEVSNALVTETSGMSGRDIHTLVASLVAENLGSEIDEALLVAQIRKIRGKSSTQVQSLSWDDIILPKETLAEFQNLGKELRNAERLEKMGISTPKGILLYGPPGTGKTQIARVLAGQSGLSFLAAATSDLKANFLGQSGSKVKQLFQQARSQAPCILFIDEIDVVAGSRAGSNDQLMDEIVGQLLQEIDGVASKAGQVFLLAASNHPENIDAALLSRLERKIEIGLPDQTARAQILKLLLSSKPVAFNIEEEAERLATLTEGMSGRDLNSLVTRATRKAVNRAMSDDEATDALDQIQIMSEDFEFAEQISS